ncbi:DUF721 domain-containing protein [Consotaella salsifontis]|uniref:DUF721 domain-containing protein n=1 Tax=Consotaella salsifontis TaxID=1365950 RepID=A0A1T4MW50_9HYPH|nr:DciA family protein [Consotaella salsifontis]SJZ71037.1 hypothetical protein SAMN05428963_102308 [Consotaella salsifontis]
MKKAKRGAQLIGDLVAPILDPVLARKAGMSSTLAAAWADIAGSRLAETTRPERLLWPPRRDADDPFRPATLVVACEGPAALLLQHQTREMIARVNALFGYGAVDRIKIVQRPVRRAKPSRKPVLRDLKPADRQQIDRLTAGVEDEKLREALAAYGASVLQRRHTPS